jgi:fatty-acyl-CoA synthase
MSANGLPTVGMQCLRAFARHPERIAFSWDSGSVTYRGAMEMLGRMQAVLIGLGLPTGSCVAFLSANRADAWLASIAVQLCGFATNWLHPLGSLDDQLFQLDDSISRVLIFDSEKFAERAAELAQRAQSVETLLGLGPSGAGRDLLHAADQAGSTSPRDLATLDSPCTFRFTGGTTGRAKGMLRLHRQQAHTAGAHLVNFEFPERPHYFAIGPISHIAGGKILPSLMRGGTVHLARKGFDPEQVLKTIARERINMTLLVPTMIYTLLDTPAAVNVDTSSLELLLYGASPMAPSRLEEGIARFGRIFSQLYGSSECYPISVLRKAEHDLKRPDLLLSCGYPAIGCDVRLLNDDDQDVAPGETGEVCVRAPQAMLEYWRQPELTAETLRGGWLHTGDMGRADERGYLYLVDRKKDMIVSGGFNIYPREIEDILTSHPDVAMAAVVGVPHQKWGEAVTALIVRKPGAHLEAAELIDLVKRKKGSLYAPKQLTFVSELPLTPVGKIDKKALKAASWAGHGRMIG